MHYRSNIFIGVGSEHVDYNTNLKIRVNTKGHFMCALGLYAGISATQRNGVSVD